MLWRAKTICAEPSSNSKDKCAKPQRNANSTAPRHYGLPFDRSASAISPRFSPLLPRSRSLRQIRTPSPKKQAPQLAPLLLRKRLRRPNPLRSPPSAPRSNSIQIRLASNHPFAQFFERIKRPAPHDSTPQNRSNSRAHRHVDKYRGPNRVSEP